MRGAGSLSQGGAGSSFVYQRLAESPLFLTEPEVGIWLRSQGNMEASDVVVVVVWARVAH